MAFLSLKINEREWAMKIYILFNYDKGFDFKRYNLIVKDKIAKCAKELLKYSEDINVDLKNAKNIDSDIKIILDKMPSITDRNVRLESLNAFKNNVYNILNDKPYGIEIRNVSITADTSFEPMYESKDNIQLNNRECSEASEFDYHKKAMLYKPVEPSYTFDRVILPNSVSEKIEESLNIITYENKVFDEWGLSIIQPHPSSALSFYGPSGTGKTMAAEAIASKLRRKILKVSYADIESKFHGEGPKMVKAIFLAAQNSSAVLFIDEADSLLSKRLTNVTQGSEQAINSMRSQLLMCLEEFRGIVIFATNLVVNYDQAFLTRLISIKFIEPDIESREKIWRVHIYPTNNNKLNIPLADDVDITYLAENYSFCGREIRSAVISACVRAAMSGNEIVCQDDFIHACDKLIQEQIDLKNVKDHSKSSINEETKSALKELIKK